MASRQSNMMVIVAVFRKRSQCGDKLVGLVNWWLGIPLEDEAGANPVKPYFNGMN